MTMKKGNQWKLSIKLVQYECSGEVNLKNYVLVKESSVGLL